ncbi:MAG: hypothetical protein WCH61_02480, partial [bacterium]
GALLLYALTLPSAWKTAEVRAQVELEKQRQASVGSGVTKIQTVRDQRNAAIQTMNAEIEAGNVARQETADTQGRLFRLTDTLAKLERDLAVKRDEAKAQSAITAEHQAVVKALDDKVAALRRERGRLVTEYRTLMADLRRDFLERMVTRKPERMRQFYSSRQDTPFGPPALFFAAEFLYEMRNSKDASRLYKELLRKYPDSAYLAAVRTRQAQIQAHEPYVRKDDIGLHLYRPLVVNEDETDTRIAPPIEKAL